VRLEPISATFHGRDIFAPVAAHVALGAGLAELGEPMDPAELLTLERPAPVVEGGRVTAAVTYVDRFGNVALGLRADDLDETELKLGRTAVVEANGRERELPYALTFADVPAGSPLLYLDSYGNLALAVNRGSAAELFGVGAGDTVALRRA